MLGNLDILLDRALAASAGMSASLCLLVFLTLQTRGARPRAGRIIPADKIADSTTALLNAARLGFMGLFVRYVTTVLARTGWVSWSTFSSDCVLLACDLGVIGAALYAVRQMTFTACGNRGFAVFGGVALIVGAVLYVWG